VSRIMGPFRRLPAAFAACLALWIAPAAAVPLSGVYVFGDSLVDSGNASKAARTFGIFLPGVEDPTPASLGYFEGRFTNGYTFADHFSIAITGKPPKSVFPYGYPLPLFGQIRFAKPKGNTMNFAYGGAQGIEGDEDVPGSKAQVTAYKALPGGADPNALYIINFGGNDLFQVIDDGYSAAKTASYLGDVAARIASQIARLEAIGAQHFLVTGAPDIGIAPAYPDPDVQARATAASLLLDSLIQLELAELRAKASFTGELLFFSYFDFIEDVFTQPEIYGLPELNFTDLCITVRTPDANGNIDCTGLAFFDDVHPTAEVHHALFQAMSSLVFPVNARALLAVAQVPEPAALALFGVGMIGIAVTRRRSRRG